MHGCCLDPRVGRGRFDRDTKPARDYRISDSLAQARASIVRACTVAVTPSELGAPNCTPNPYPFILTVNRRRHGRHDRAHGGVQILLLLLPCDVKVLVNEITSVLLKRILHEFYLIFLMFSLLWSPQCATNGWKAELDILFCNVQIYRLVYIIMIYSFQQQEEQLLVNLIFLWYSNLVEGQHAHYARSGLKLIITFELAIYHITFPNKIIIRWDCCTLTFYRICV
ncbi:hypothetical protein ACJX0J_027691, partial [Zea mays]